MRFYLHALHAASLAVFRHGDKEAWDRVDALEKANLRVCEAVFEGLSSGLYSVAWVRDGTQLLVIHRSGRGIQCSHFGEVNGKTVAFSHKDIKSGTDIQDDVPPRHYINVWAA